MINAEKTIKNVVDLDVNDFKNYFKKEFKYVIDWEEEKNYKKDVIVFYNDVFFISLINNNINNKPDISPDAWEIIDVDIKQYTTDEDIQKAMIQARGNYNENLFKKDVELMKATYFLLVAHYIVMDKYMGIGGGATNFTITSKSVGSVSASYSIPQKLMDKPLFAYLSRTEFGMKYISYLLTRSSGNVRTIIGTTTLK